MKFHQGGGVFCFDDVPIKRIIREYESFKKIRDGHYGILAAIGGKKYG